MVRGGRIVCLWSGEQMDRIDRIDRMNRMWGSRRQALMRRHGMEHEELTKVIIGCAMRVHRELGPGFLESVYQNALAHEIRKANLPLQCACRIQVCYAGVVVGKFVADMVVGGCVLVENKAVQALAASHGAQLVNYLVATRIETGLLFNFGCESLQFKRKFRTYRHRQSSHIGQDSSPSPFQSIIPPTRQ